MGLLNNVRIWNSTTLKKSSTETESESSLKQRVGFKSKKLRNQAAVIEGRLPDDEYYCSRILSSVTHLVTNYVVLTALRQYKQVANVLHSCWRFLNSRKAQFKRHWWQKRLTVKKDLLESSSFSWQLNVVSGWYLVERYVLVSGIIDCSVKSVLKEKWNRYEKLKMISNNRSKLVRG